MDTDTKSGATSSAKEGTNAGADSGLRSGDVPLVPRGPRRRLGTLGRLLGCLRGVPALVGNPLRLPGRDLRRGWALDEMVIEAVHCRPELMAGAAVRGLQLGPALVAASAAHHGGEVTQAHRLTSGVDRQGKRLLRRRARTRRQRHRNGTWGGVRRERGRDRAPTSRAAGRHPAILSYTGTSVTQPGVDSSEFFGIAPFAGPSR